MSTVTLTYCEPGSFGTVTLTGEWVDHSTAIENYIEDGGSEFYIEDVTCDSPDCDECA